MQASKTPAENNSRTKTARKPAFILQVFLDSAGLKRKLVDFRKKETIFSQGDPAEDVLYVQKGGVRLSVVNESGKEAVVAVLGPGDFFGEGCLAGQPIRIGTTTAIAPTTALVSAYRARQRAQQRERKKKKKKAPAGPRGSTIFPPASFPAGFRATAA